MPPAYWLQVCQGMDAATAWVSAADDRAAPALLDRYPILSLPEFSSAIAALAGAQERREGVAAYLQAANRLEEWRAFLSQEYRSQYAELLLRCGTALGEESRGDPRVNNRRALDLFTLVRRSAPAGSAIYAISMMNEGIARVQLARFGVDTLRNLEEGVRSCAQARSLYPRDDQGYQVHFAMCLMNEGAARRHLARAGRDPVANLERAIALWQEAIGLFPPEHIDVGRCLMNEGSARRELALLGQDPRRNLEEAIRLCTLGRQKLPRESPEFAGCLINEAQARDSLADLVVQSREQLGLAVQLYGQGRALLPPHDIDHVRAMIGEAMARHGLAALGADPEANLTAALELYREAYPRLPKNSPDAAVCLLNAGSAHQRRSFLRADARGDLEAAVALYKQARGIFASESPQFAQCLVLEGRALGLLSRRLDQPRETIEAALRLCEEGGRRLRAGGANLDAMYAHASQGVLAREHGLWEASRAGFEQAIEALEDVRRTTSLLRDRREWMERHIILFKGMVEACLRLERYEDAMKYVERGRSRVLLDLLITEDLSPRAASAEKVEAYSRVRRRAEELEAALAIREDKPQTADWDQERVRVLAREKADVARQLAGLADEIRAEDPDFFALAKPLEIDQIRAVAQQLGRVLVMIWIGPQAGMAFVVDRSGRLATIPLPDASDAAIRALAVGDDASSPAGWVGTYLRYRRGELDRKSLMAAMETMLTALYERLAGPVHRWLRERGEHRAAFVTAGNLGLLPLHAAMWKDGNTVRHLIDEIELVYAPSAWLFSRCAQRVRPHWTPVLGVGDPTRVDALPLVFSDWEVGRLGDLVKAAAGAPAFQRIPGGAATFEHVRAALGTAAVTHFSCHGQWDFAEPLRSGLMLAGAERLIVSDLLAPPRLDHARLVVLSACESATGFTPGSLGEEYLGLPGGFIFAGAASVVGSLWSVLDAPTAILMTKMYEGLLEQRLGIAEALRQAQLWLKALPRVEATGLLRSHAGTIARGVPRNLADEYERWVAGLEDPPFAHPYYWAAFQVLGSPDPVLRPGGHG